MQTQTQAQAGNSPLGATAAKSATSAGPAAEPLPPIEKVIVAIHGIGQQRRSETIRSVASQFALRGTRPVPLMPLGYFSVGPAGGLKPSCPPAQDANPRPNATQVKVSRLEVDADDQLANIGFVEVYWADIPRAVVKEADTLEETKAWGKTIVSRAEAAYRQRVANGNLQQEDFRLAAGVIDEIIESVKVIENLTFLTDKMGIFKFDVAPLLRDYIDDVQVFTEFEHLREKILARFHRLMAAVAGELAGDGNVRKAPEIYLVAHSEGSVVGFVGLLQAMARLAITDPENERRPIATGWIEYVRGFMTIGSPIDKHIMLWDRLWHPFEGRLACTRREGKVVFDQGPGQPALTLPAPIDWRNYYDYGDPIGFELDATRRFLGDERIGCVAFEFEAEHDMGFGRYVFPGKAHIDYWADAQVFGHFIDSVVLPADPARPERPQEPGHKATQRGSEPAPPPNRPLHNAASYALPYVVVAALHLLAVYLLFKAVNVYLQTEHATTVREMAFGVGSLALLLLGVTFAARVPRLVKVRSMLARRDNGSWKWQGPAPGQLRWLAAAVLVFSCCAAMTYGLLPDKLGLFLGSAGVHVVGLLRLSGVPAGKLGTVVVIAVAAAVAATGWWARRSARRGRQWLLWSGAAAVAVMVGRKIDAAWNLGIDKSPEIWPVLLAGGAFLYLWWLAISLFDLAFVWHRYIRHSVAEKALMAWRDKKDLQPDAIFGAATKPAGGAAQASPPGNPPESA